MTSYSIGLDLGQAQDFSALAVLEHVDILPPGWTPRRYFSEDQRGRPVPRSDAPPPTRELRVVHLHRWPLGTPYHEVVDGVARLSRSHELNGSRLFFDRSGVGRAVGDLLWEAHLHGHTGDTQPEGRTITGGDRSGRRGVAKKDLISARRSDPTGPVQDPHRAAPGRRAGARAPASSSSSHPRRGGRSSTLSGGLGKVTGTW